LLGKGARFLNMKVVWDILGHRNNQSKDGIREAQKALKTGVTNPPGGRQSEE
jgi:hypothetical protein